MKHGESFEDILNQMLAASSSDVNEVSSAPLTASASSPSFSERIVDNFNFRIEYNPQKNLKPSAFRTRAYYEKSSPTPTSAAPLTLVSPERKSSAPERKWPVIQLSAAAQLALDTLAITGPSVSVRIVKKAYRRLAARLHPDAQTAGATTAIAHSYEEFLAIQEAYDIILNELTQLESIKTAA